ncbi:hypothetical protein BDP81DRAFT_66318 [Colletotrichum phormii]|uniref:Uncharacterized protein n=1 Tax=Colletotrichum phormii TaxID=359342 RepID=A0AAI9ZP04_9PEZI|nr:uncharacterized protein BDP81DRAFT_66318 [Colletotrichum phormii]KAK1634154.1 hypothetical protein BDP81DRAFT_66318 [Colletotrichum phormii]
MSPLNVSRVCPSPESLLAQHTDKPYLSSDPRPKWREEREEQKEEPSVGETGDRRGTKKGGGLCQASWDGTGRPPHLAAAHHPSSCRPSHFTSKVPFLGLVSANEPREPHRLPHNPEWRASES